jgi:hypothetical protein
LNWDLERRTEYTDRVMDLATKISHPLYQILALHHRGSIARHCGRYHESLWNHREAQKLARLNGRVREESTNLTSEAMALCRLGNFPEAQGCAAQGYDLLMKTGFEESELELKHWDTMMEIHWQKAEYTEAHQVAERMVQMTSQHRSPYFHAYSVISLAQLSLIIGLKDTVIMESLALARELATELRFGQGMQMCNFLQAELDLRNGDRLKAYTVFQILGGKTESQSDTVYLSMANLGDLSNDLCGLEQTFRWAATYFAFSRKSKHLGHTYQALRYLGDILLAQGDEETAMSIFQAVLDASTEMDVHRRRADCMSRMGDILVHSGEPGKAKHMWEAAHPLFVRSSQANDAATIEVKLAQL